MKAKPSDDWHSRSERKEAIKAAVKRAKTLGFTNKQIAAGGRWNPPVLSAFLRTGYASDKRLDSLESWLDTKQLLVAEDPAPYAPAPPHEETDDEIMEGLAEKLRALADYLSSPADLCSRVKAFSSQVTALYDNLDKLTMTTDKRLEKGE